MKMGHSLSYQLALADILARHLATSLDVAALLDDVALMLHQHFNLEAAFFFLPYHDSWQLVAGRDAEGSSLLNGTRARVLPRSDSARSHTGFLVAPRDKEIEPPQPRLEARGGRWVLPLIYEGQSLGLMDLYPAQPLTDVEETEIDTLCEPLATALQQAYNKSAKPLPTRILPTPSSNIFEMLYEGLTEIAQATDVQSVLQLITDFVQASGWRMASASLRERSRFRITHMASSGLTQKEHDTLLRTAQDGSVWFARFGPEFERFRQDDWYYLPYSDPTVAEMNLANNGVLTQTPYHDGATWHPLDLLYLPMRDRDGEPIGLVNLDDPEDQQAPTIESMRAIQLFVRNAALMLENQRLHGESKRRLDATQVVQETAALVSASLHVQNIIQHLIDQMVKRFAYPLVAIYLREGGRYVLAGEYGYPDGTYFEYVNDSIGIVGRAARTKSTQWVPDVAQDVDYIMGNPAVTSEIAVPMLRGNELLGFINVESYPNRPLTLEDKELLETLSEQLTTAIINAQLFNETQQHALQLETASEVSRRITSILNIDQLLAEVVHLIRRNFGYYHVHVFLADPESGGWVVREGSGMATERMKEVRHTRASEEGIVGQVGATGMSILVQDVSKDPRHVFNPFLPNTKAELGVPLRLGAQVFGVLDVQSDQLYGLTESDQAIMETLGNQIAVALNNAQLFSEIESQLNEREGLYRASYAISGAQDLHEVLVAMVKPLAVPHIVRAGLLAPDRAILDGTPDSLRVAAVWNPTSTPLLIQPGTRLKADVMPSLHRMASDQVQVVNNISEDERVDQVTRSILQQLGVRAIALVPLRAGTRIVGWLLLMSNRFESLDEPLLRPYQTLADQAALAVERVQLLAQTQQRAVRLTALNTLAANITSTLDLQQTLEDSVRAMALLFGVRQSGVLLFEANNTRGRLVAQYREDGYQHQEEIVVPLINNPLTERLLETRAPVYVSDVNTDPLAVTIRAGRHPRSYSALLVVPLLTRERVIGSISLDVVEGDDRRFEPEEIDLAQTMSAQIAAAIENARLYEEAKQRAHDMETASQVGQHLTRVLNEEEVIRAVVHLIAERFQFYHVGIYLRDSDHSNRLSLREGSGALGRALRARRHVLWEGQGLPGHVLLGGQALVANDVLSDNRFQRNSLLPASAAEAAIPLTLAGDLLGVLDLHSEKPDAFPGDIMAVLSTIADQIAIALQNARLFAAQRETVHQLQEVDRLKSEFLASMSHELRTPLNSIIGFSKIILRGIDGPLTDLQRQDLTSIYNSGQHLLSLINDILDLSKIVAGRMELNKHPLDLSEVTAEVLRTVEPQAAEYQLRLETHTEDNLPAALADRVRVRQIMLNLVSNAVKFTEKGGVFVTARRVANPRPSDEKKECVGDPNGKFIEIAVKDTGVGIKKEDLELIFEEFRQVGRPGSRRAGGTGLGLAIARRFAELHGGGLWVESRYGSGSTFRFTLPIVADTGTLDASKTPSEEREEQAGKGEAA